MNTFDGLLIDSKVKNIPQRLNYDKATVFLSQIKTQSDTATICEIDNYFTLNDQIKLRMLKYIRYVEVSEQ